MSQILLPPSYFGNRSYAELKALLHEHEKLRRTRIYSQTYHDLVRRSLQQILGLT